MVMDPEYNPDLDIILTFNICFIINICHIHALRTESYHDDRVVILYHWWKSSTCSKSHQIQIMIQIRVISNTVAELIRRKLHMHFEINLAVCFEKKHILLKLPLTSMFNSKWILDSEYDPDLDMNVTEHLSCHKYVICEVILNSFCKVLRYHIDPVAISHHWWKSSKSHQIRIMIQIRVISNTVAELIREKLHMHFEINLAVCFEIKAHLTQTPISLHVKLEMDPGSRIWSGSGHDCHRTFILS